MFLWAYLFRGAGAMTTIDAQRYQHVARAIAMLRMLRHRWSSLSELSTALGVSQRSVRRIIDVLRAHQVEIVSRPRARPGYAPVVEYHTAVEV